LLSTGSKIEKNNIIMSLCILSGAKLTTFAVSLFTLSWTHSVEKIEWQEDWKINNTQLEIIEARVQGSGAGMDPPDGSKYIDGWWTYKPNGLNIKELYLSTSNANLMNWKICFNGSCQVLDNNHENPIKVFPCD